MFACLVQSSFIVVLFQGFFSVFKTMSLPFQLLRFKENAGA